MNHVRGSEGIDEANMNDEDVPDEFLHGGMNFMERWKQVVAKPGTKVATRDTRKVKQMLYFFEANIPGFLF